MIDSDIVHCHTWYSNFAGIIAKLAYEKPLIVTTHSLEPLRPWKREQLGGGYDVSSWVEKMALEMADKIIAVSKDAKEDILKFFNVDPSKIEVIYNGIDLNEFKPTPNSGVLERYGINPNLPYVLFVGRITRQKGIIHLVNAIEHIVPEAQVVLCAGAPDTKEIEQEMAHDVSKIQETRSNVIWIREMVEKNALIELYSNSAVFCCPSIYEPFGIINLEAMACKTAVVASAVGGIKEVVVNNETGFLVPVRQLETAPFEPVDPQQFSKDLAEKINILIKDDKLRETMAQNGLKRAVELFSWDAIAHQTHKVYESVIQSVNIK